LSIYATLWILKFPEFGQHYYRCKWTEVTAQGVPPHIGTPTAGFGYEEGDPFAEFLPSAVAVSPDGETECMRAVVFVGEQTRKGTPRSGQEYENPLFTLSGKEYASLSFDQLHQKICEALRGDQPRVVFESINPDGAATVYFEDGTSRSFADKE
jgi:hypothetical protein